jgi:hypothetical protein
LFAWADTQPFGSIRSRHHGQASSHGIQDLYPRPAAAASEFDEGSGAAVKGLGIVECPNQLYAGDAFSQASQLIGSSPTADYQCGVGQAASQKGKGVLQELAKTLKIGRPTQSPKKEDNRLAAWRRQDRAVKHPGLRHVR